MEKMWEITIHRTWKYREVDKRSPTIFSGYLDYEPALSAWPHCSFRNSFRSTLQLVVTRQSKQHVEHPVLQTKENVKSRLAIFAWRLPCFLCLVISYLEQKSHCKRNKFGIPSLTIQIGPDKTRMNCIDLDWFILSGQLLIQDLCKHNLSRFWLWIGSYFVVVGSEWK